MQRNKSSAPVCCASLIFRRLSAVVILYNHVILYIVTAWRSGNMDLYIYFYLIIFRFFTFVFGVTACDLCFSSHKIYWSICIWPLLTTYADNLRCPIAQRKELVKHHNAYTRTDAGPTKLDALHVKKTKHMIIYFWFRLNRTYNHIILQNFNSP